MGVEFKILIPAAILSPLQANVDTISVDYYDYMHTSDWNVHLTSTGVALQFLSTFPSVFLSLPLYILYIHIQTHTPIYTPYIHTIYSNDNKQTRYVTLYCSHSQQYFQLQTTVLARLLYSVTFLISTIVVPKRDCKLAPCTVPIFTCMVLASDDGHNSDMPYNSTAYPKNYGHQLPFKIACTSQYHTRPLHKPESGPAWTDTCITIMAY